MEQQKQQAPELLRAIRSGHPEALARLVRHQARWASTAAPIVRQFVTVRDAQAVLAREQGSPHPPPPRPRPTRIFETGADWLTGRVHGLLVARESAIPEALDQIRDWHPRFHDLPDEEILQLPFTVEDARLVYAREHGFDTWTQLAAHAKSLAANPEPFQTAFAALRTGDRVAFAALLRQDPSLARERGTNGNTLLNLAVSLNAEAPIQSLIAAGAGVNEANNRGWTPLHQAAYANNSEIASLLLENGAELDAEAHGAGGTPLVVALFWGHREVADRLARRQVTPNNLRTAAALGRPDLVEACFLPDGSLTPEAGSARGFYRPHSGFPGWQPSPVAQEILDEALVWACKSNRLEVLDRLVQAGARPNADPYRGTPLIWAAVCNRKEAAAWLLAHGADINQKATFGGLQHGQGITALHLAAQYGHLPVVKLLVENGADLSLKDDLYHATAEGAANHFGQTEVWDYLQSMR